MNSSPPSGFSYAEHKTSVRIRHHHRVVTTLRGAAAQKFLERVHAPGADAQQVMARATGHYKHGNERHPGG